MYTETVMLNVIAKSVKMNVEDLGNDVYQLHLTDGWNTITINITKDEYSLFKGALEYYD